MIALTHESPAGSFAGSSMGYLFFDGSSRDAWLAAHGARRHIRTLSEKGDAVEAAANLFAVLHEMDRMGLSGIRAELAPAGGLGDAINDRLSRAAAK
jgi:L-threonylcarbamoyladenylate synthase